MLLVSDNNFLIVFIKRCNFIKGIKIYILFSRKNIKNLGKNSA